MKKKNYIKPEMVEEFPDTPLICQSLTGSAHGQDAGSPWGARRRSRYSSYYDIDSENDFIEDSYENNSFYQSYNNSEESIW